MFWKICKLCRVLCSLGDSTKWEQIKDPICLSTARHSSHRSGSVPNFHQL